ncbi:TPA: hypothetical protein ACXZLZ_004204 [Salmonella enterica]|nr:hypothetical protein [Salmonella enterica subsp. enterica serovar Havana]
MQFRIKKVRCLLLFFACVSSCKALADCTGTISLPLSMVGSQNQLKWSGTIGGAGNGSALSNCTTAVRYQNDYRYNIVETSASCTNAISGSTYSAPVTTIGANLQTGPMQKLSSIVFGDKTYDVWGALFNSPAIQLPVDGTTGGSYSTNSSIDISALPAGNYSCFVRNTHGAFGTDSNNLALGAPKVFNYANNRGGWATGLVNITIFSSCSIPNSLYIDHGTLMAGTQDIKQGVISVICNKNNNVKVSLRADGDLANGVEVKVGGDKGSRSTLSTSGDGVSYGKQTSLSVKSNRPEKIYFKSDLLAAGEGLQTGRAFAQITYD